MSRTSPPLAPPLPGAWHTGELHFSRPDVRGGDRPVGASFASRTAAYGLNGAAGTAHPIATQIGIEMLRRAVRRSTRRSRSTPVSASSSRLPAELAAIAMR